MDSSIQDDSRLNDSQSLRGKKRKTLDDYEFITNENSRTKTSDLGKGSYGSVKKVRDKETGKQYAMKIMNKKQIFEYSTKENLRREINIQKNIFHPHITRLYTYFEDKENVYLILELAENGSLFHYLRKRRKFSENEAFVYFFQTCLGIDYLHKKKIIHRDLKPENLLLDKDGNIKLCDFGWSAESYSKRHTFCGTIDYMAPEMIKNLPHDHRLDIWCLGVLLFEMLHGYAPFKGRNDQEKCLNIAKNASIDFDKSLSPEVMDLIRNILKPAPVDRYGMEQIFSHSWMKKIEKYYDISIQTFVSQQDEQIRGESSSLTSLGDNEKSGSISSQGGNNSLGKKTPPSDINTNGNNNAKIITIIDNTSPLNLKAKSFQFEQKSSGSNSSSTKYSSGASDGSDVDQLLRKYEIDDTPEMSLLNKIDNFSKGGPTNNSSDSGMHYKLQNRNNGFKNNVFENNNQHQINRSKQKEEVRCLKSPDFGNEISKFSKPYDKNLNGNAQHRGLRKNNSNNYDDFYQNENEVPHFGINSSAEKNQKRYKSLDKGSNLRSFRDDKQKRRFNNKKFYQAVDEEDDIEPQRLSRISKRNVEISKKLTDDDEEPGFFERILMSLGCISRDTGKNVYKD